MKIPKIPKIPKISQINNKDTEPKSDKYIKELYDVLTKDLELENFNNLTEMVNYCPSQMHKLITAFKKKVSYCTQTHPKIQVNENIKNLKPDDKKLEEKKESLSITYKLLKLSEASFFLRHWERTNKNYKDTVKVYAKLLREYGYEYQQNDQSSYNPRVISDQTSCKTLSCFFIALHELITLLSEPQKLDFNSIKPDSINANYNVENMNLFVKGKIYYFW